MAEMVEEREVDIGGRKVTVRALTVGQMHQWWRDQERHERDEQRAGELRAKKRDGESLTAAESGELKTLEAANSRRTFEQMFAVGPIGYSDIARMTDLGPEDIDALTQGAAAAIAKACEEANEDFFAGRRKMADITQRLLTSAPSSPG